MDRDSNRPAGIREIAETLGISIGTVDRALHGRSGVSPKTRDKVLKTAQRLNYTPNVVARSLRLNRRLRIGVFLPEQISSFFDPIRDGIRSAAENWSGSVVEVIFHAYPRLGEGEIKAMQAANWKTFDGVILAPGDPAAMSMLARNCDTDPPLMYVATDAPRTTRLGAVTVDAVVSGAIAAELLGELLPAGTPVVVFTGDLKVTDHADKLRGFAASLATLAPHLSLLPAIQTHELPEGAYDAALEVLRKCPEVGGIYINTANSLPVLKAAAEVGALGKVKIITTDLFSELIPLIESKYVFASLYQRPFVQGKTAFEVLCRYLSAGIAPTLTYRMAPHIILRSNLSLFIDQSRELK